MLCQIATENKTKISKICHICYVTSNICPFCPFQSALSQVETNFQPVFAYVFDLDHEWTNCRKKSNSDWDQNYLPTFGLGHLKTRLVRYLDQLFVTQFALMFFRHGVKIFQLRSKSLEGDNQYRSNGKEYLRLRKENDHCQFHPFFIY